MTTTTALTTVAGKRDSSEDDDGGGIQASRARTNKGVSTPGAVDIKMGHFAFTPAEEAPFLVGKIVDARRANDVDEGAEDEVQIHWWSPSNRNTRDKAWTESLQSYGTVVFAKTTCARTTEEAVRRLVADVSWDSVSVILATVVCISYHTLVIIFWD